MKGQKILQIHGILSEKNTLVDIMNSNESVNAKLVLIKEKLYDTDNQNCWSEVHNYNENGNKLRSYRQFKYVLSCSSFVRNAKTVHLEEHCRIFEVGHSNLQLRLEGMPSPKFPYRTGCVYFAMVPILNPRHIFPYIVIFMQVFVKIFL